MKSRVRELIQIGDRLFSKRYPLLSRWQDIAENFYVERADFTNRRLESDDFAAHLMTSVPSLARRDLANAFSYMLRPRGQAWFIPRTGNEAINDDRNALKWLDWAGEVMRRAMYDPMAQFIRCTKEGDNDFATFGQTVISLEVNYFTDSLLYRCWHLRDVVWKENSNLEIDTVHRQWMIEARDLVRLFPKTVVQRVKDLAEEHPFTEIKCRHIVMPIDEYDSTGDAPPPKNGRLKKFKYISIYVDCENDVILEETPRVRLGYIIPRWQTLSGSQYAHSPATVISIPDARMLQNMSLTLLEAGQKAVDPPMIGQADVVRGAVNIYAGGVTWVDSEYDEKLGEALRPLKLDRTGIQFGIDREERIQQLIHKAFFIDQLELPEVGAEKMTAYETQIRMEEYMRRALPLFEPMESEYNGQICDNTFEILMEQGTFGDAVDVPDILKGQEIKFQFESPIQTAANRANAKAFQDAMGLLAIAAQLDPSAVHVLDVHKGLADAIEGAGAPADWLRSDEDVAQLVAADQQKLALEQAAMMAAGGGAAAEQVGKGAEALQKGGVVPQGGMQEMMAAAMGGGGGGQ